MTYGGGKYFTGQPLNMFMWSSGQIYKINLMWPYFQLLHSYLKCRTCLSEVIISALWQELISKFNGLFQLELSQSFCVCNRTILIDQKFWSLW
jgi:hypothetical protein